MLSPPDDAGNSSPTRRATAATATSARSANEGGARRARRRAADSGCYNCQLSRETNARRRRSCGAVPDPGCGRSCGRATRAGRGPRSFGPARGRSASHCAFVCHEPSALRPPSAPIMCRCGCHCRRSPALATATAPRVAFAARVADELLDCLGAGACELAEQLRPPAKQRSQEAWDGEHHSAQRICFFFSHEGRRAGTTTPPGSATTSSRPTPTSTRLPATLECWPRPPPAGCSAAAADEVGGGVLETLLVFGCDPVAHVGGETGMSPGEQLPDQLLRDRALVGRAARREREHAARADAQARHPPPRRPAARAGAVAGRSHGADAFLTRAA